MAKETEQKVEVIVLKTFNIGRKRFPLWTHQMLEKKQAETQVKIGNVKYAE